MAKKNLGRISFFENKLSEKNSFCGSVVSNSYGSKLPYKTRSLCPECTRVLPATVYAKKGKVFISRKCPLHGVFDEIYWESASEFERARKFAHKSRGIGTSNVSVTKNSGTNCPFDCGLCTNHQNHTALANMVLTNRCDLSCWYCFFYAKDGDPIYEPTIEQIDKMFLNLKAQKPVATNAIQFTGGEPTLRKDLIQIIKLAKKRGFEHIQLNTHGINFALNPKLAKDVAKAGVSTIYMSFDGVTAKSNPKNHYEIPRALDACRAAKLAVVLVPTVIKGVNDGELGEIINFALNNFDVVRGVNFQPVSFVGRMPKSLRNKERITIPRAEKLIEEQTKGIIKQNYFFTVPCVSSVTNFVEAITGSNQYSLSTHYGCGAASYLFFDGEKVIPLPEFFDVVSFFDFLNKSAQRIKSYKLYNFKSTRIIESAKLLIELTKCVDSKKVPKGIDLVKMLVDVLVKHDYSSLGKFSDKTLFIGMMHFMDSYNYDQQRVERCQIHYAMPDGRIIPFCAFNVIPQIYRDKVQKAYALPWEEWSKLNSDKSPGLKYKRNVDKFENEEIYKKTYLEKNNF
ncbi:MAG: radical SAM protein [archaeon]